LKNGKVVHMFVLEELELSKQTNFINSRKTVNGKMELKQIGNFLSLKT
jgi:hypothetical protein